MTNLEPGVYQGLLADYLAVTLGVVGNDPRSLVWAVAGGLGLGLAILLAGQRPWLGFFLGGLLGGISIWSGTLVSSSLVESQEVSNSWGYGNFLGGFFLAVIFAGVSALVTATVAYYRARTSM